MERGRVVGWGGVGWGRGVGLTNNLWPFLSLHLVPGPSGGARVRMTSL
jgi:hypothetical protein